MKRDIPILGFMIGLVLPIVGLAVMYLLWFRSNTFPDFLRILWVERQVASKVLSLSLLVELIPFLYYTTKRLDQTAKGIMVITIIYAVLIILMHFNFFM